MTITGKAYEFEELAKYTEEEKFRIETVDQVNVLGTKIDEKNNRVDELALTVHRLKSELDSALIRIRDLEKTTALLRDNIGRRTRMDMVV